MEPSWTKLTHPDHTTIIVVHVDESLFWLQTRVCKPSQPTQQHVSCFRLKKETGNSQILESKLAHAHYHQCNRYKAVFFLLRKNRPGIEANTNISNTVLYTDLTFLNLKVTCTYVYNHAAHTTWSSTSGIMTDNGKLFILTLQWVPSSHHTSEWPTWLQQSPVCCRGNEQHSHTWR